MIAAGMDSSDSLQMFLATGCLSQETPDLLNPEGNLCGACLGTNASIPLSNETVTTPVTPVESQTIQLQFRRTIELYEAVDEYMIDKSPFSLTSQKYGHPIGAWDVSLITNFESLFDSERNPLAARFNEDLNSWDVSSALIFDRMFAGAKLFNGNISSWSTLRAQSMAHMFDGAASFNGDLSQWNTEKCSDMSYMFRGALLFNGDLSNFDTLSVTDTSFMFHRAHSFAGRGLNNWSVENVKTMESMFEEALSFQSDISNWNVSSVTDMSRAFRFATQWTGDIGSWDVSNVESFSFCFSGALSWNSDISRWSVFASDLEGMVRVLFVCLSCGSLTFGCSLLEHCRSTNHCARGRILLLVGGYEQSVCSVQLHVPTREIQCFRHPLVLCA